MFHARYVCVSVCVSKTDEHSCSLPHFLQPAADRCSPATNLEVLLNTAAQLVLFGNTCDDLHTDTQRSDLKEVSAYFCETSMRYTHAQNLSNAISHCSEESFSCTCVCMCKRFHEMMPLLCIVIKIHLHLLLLPKVIK